MPAMRSAVTALLLLAIVVSCTGCPNPNTYGTPRTVPSGKLSHTVALEGYNFSLVTTRLNQAPNGTLAPETKRESNTYGHLPTYQMRIGLADRFDLGVRIANLSSLGFDVKYNFIKSAA